MIIKTTRLLFCISMSLVVFSACSSRKTITKSMPEKKTAVDVSSSAIVRDARKLIDSPYRYGGTTPAGFDCSGLVFYIHDKHGVLLPRRSADQSKYGKSVSVAKAKEGDLMFFKNGTRINHVGIISDTRGKFPSMIHASSSKGVIETDLDQSDYWRSRFAFIRRL